jgi:hypothetical protein
MHTFPIKNRTPLHLHIAYLSGFKIRGVGLGRRAGVCNLIRRSLFHYYGDYSTSLPSIYFLYILPFSLCASLPSMCFLYMLP